VRAGSDVQKEQSESYGVDAAGETEPLIPKNIMFWERKMLKLMRHSVFRPNYAAPLNGQASMEVKNNDR
jgi:hypothetical protein